MEFRYIIYSYTSFATPLLFPLFCLAGILSRDKVGLARLVLGDMLIEGEDVYLPLEFFWWLTEMSGEGGMPSFKNKDPLSC